MATSLGIGRLARCGCLVRDPEVLETMARVRTLAFDKTGTLTTGRARLVAIESAGVASAEVLARAAALERHSEHALAQAIVAAAHERGIEPAASGNARVVPGRGIRASVGGQPVAAGNAALMRELGWPLPPALAERASALEASGHSTVYVGWGGQIYGVLALDDAPLAEASATLAALRARGIELMLLSGDIAPAAGRLAKAVGIDDVHAALSPEAKRAVLERCRNRSRAVAMVGDGLNDGPVLAAADIGIAVGSATDLARETASLVLPLDGLWLLPWVIDVARAVRGIVRSNLLWAFGYNLIALTFAALGLLQPILAATVMAGSSVLVVMNSLRLERLPDPVPLPAPPPAQRRPAAQADAPRATVPAIAHALD
jgi:Cu2+-exporting ATPase